MDSFSFDDFQPLMNGHFEATTFDFNQQALIDSITSDQFQDSPTSILVDSPFDNYNDYYATSPSSTYSQSLSSPISDISLELLDYANILTDTNKNFSNVTELESNNAIEPSIETTILSPYIEPSLLFNRPFPNNLSHHQSNLNSNSLLFNLHNIPQDLIGSSEEISRIQAFNEEKERLKRERNNSFTNAGLLFKPLNLSSFDSYSTSSSNSVSTPSIKTREVEQLEKMVSHVGVGRGNGRRRSSVASTSSSNSSSSSSSKQEEKVKSVMGRPRGKGKVLNTISTIPPVTTGRGRKSSTGKSLTIKSKKLPLSKSSPTTTRISNRILSKQLIDFSPSPPSYTYATSIPDSFPPATLFPIDSKISSTPPPSFSSILARLHAAEKKSLLPTSSSPIQSQTSKNSLRLGLSGLGNVEIGAPLITQFSREWEEIKKSRMSEGWKAFGVEGRRSTSDSLVI